MKVRFKGNVKLRGNVTVKTRCSKGAKSSTRKRRVRRRVVSGTARLRRVMRQEIQSGVDQIRSDIQAIRPGVREDFTRELYSDRFAAFIRNAVASDSQLREIAEGLLNQTAEVSTIAGNVTGTIIEVGADYLILRETPNTILVIPFSGVNSIRPV